MKRIPQKHTWFWCKRKTHGERKLWMKWRALFFLSCRPGVPFKRGCDWWNVWCSKWLFGVVGRETQLLVYIQVADLWPGSHHTSRRFKYGHACALSTALYHFRSAPFIAHLNATCWKMNELITDTFITISYLHLFYLADQFTTHTGESWID